MHKTKIYDKIILLSNIYKITGQVSRIKPPNIKEINHLKLKCVIEVIIEGKVSNVEFVKKQLFKLFGKSLYLIIAKCEFEFTGIIGALTKKNVWIYDSDEPPKKYSAKSSASHQSTFSSRIRTRDKDICRVHGGMCPNSIKCAGHFFGKGLKYKPPNFVECGYLMSSVNGMYWCEIFELQWTKCHVCIDPANGCLYFSKEFDYEIVKIDKKASYKILDFEKKKKEVLPIEPTKEMVILYHNNVWIPKRQEMFENINKKPYICYGCNTLFEQKQHAIQHIKQTNKLCKENHITYQNPKQFVICNCNYCKDVCL